MWSVRRRWRSCILTVGTEAICYRYVDMFSRSFHVLGCKQTSSDFVPWEWQTSGCVPPACRFRERRACCNVWVGGKLSAVGCRWRGRCTRLHVERSEEVVIVLTVRLGRKAEETDTLRRPSSLLTQRILVRRMSAVLHSCQPQVL